MVVVRVRFPREDITPAEAEAASRLTTRWVRAAWAIGEYLPAARASERGQPHLVTQACQALFVFGDANRNGQFVSPEPHASASAAVDTDK